MPEHQIKFRGGWEPEPEEGLPPLERLTLPTHWPSGLEGAIRLTRRFGRPRTDSPGERYRLTFRDSPGVLTLRLNGHDLRLPEAEDDDFLVDLSEPLRDRNVLEIEVDLGRATARPRPDGWGAIALEIVS